MHKVTPISPSLGDSQETQVSLSAPTSVDTVVTREGYNRVRCSAAMIGLAISMSATSLFLPNQSRPALATGSVSSQATLTNLATDDTQTPAPATPTKLTPPALKHQVKAGETLWTLSSNYKINPEAIATSNNLSLQDNLVAGQTLKIPSEDLTQNKSKEATPTKPKATSEESLESSLDNLRETRKRLQESLVALRSEEATGESKTKVIITDVSDLKEEPQTRFSAQTRPRIVGLSPDSSDEQGIEIPVEMPSVEIDSQTSVAPQIIENNQLNTSTAASPSTITPEENGRFSRNNLSRRQLDPIPLATPDPENLANSLENNSQSLHRLKIETNNSDSSFSSSNNTLDSTIANKNSENTDLAEPQPIELQVEPPKTATVVPPLQISQPKAEQPASEKIYRVQTGDTLNNIARKHGITVAQLIKANNITNPNLIKINQPLVIPTKGTASRTQPRTTVISGVPITAQRNSSQLPPVPLPVGTQANTSTLVSRLPNNTEGVSDIPSMNATVETGTQANTDQLRADVAKLQQQYDNTQPIPIEVEPPDGSFSAPIAQQPRNSEWDKDRRLRNTNTQSTVSQPTQEQIIGTASVNIEEYNNSLRIPVGETVSPELPGLSSPDQYLPDAPARFNGYIWPTKGVLTSGYGWRWGRMHKGVDIAGPVGTPIVAAAPGEVISAGWNSGGYGNLVKVRHTDGSVTLYAHNSRILVRRGQQVEQGQLIAEMGSTGYSTGPHLHFEIHPDGSKAVNPMAFLPKDRS
ncbi:Peptidase M23 [Gloeothece citriformis PCC 7424]|uniref:Peptidase M23 n=1 Tax=Gloeothece citriformis (strain PCC 7424) TaxID=65393 RepID=B7KG45_GLOC7|nr:peptidoglycan DD-metalloendopeptidase family protein [Gloeothece citriformis]ACK70516.1 Peptidase M23 [Gloeothece citriformis PCC 7424]